MPAAEVDITVEMVRGLLAGQHSDLAKLELRPFANGWDNVLYRLGDDLLVRLPRREFAAALVANEARWLPQLQARLPIPVPSPVRSGLPDEIYPWCWTIVPFFEGKAAAPSALVDPARQARRLGEFVAALHREAPADAPISELRGVALIDRSDDTLERLDLLASEIDVEAARSAWQDCVVLPRWGGAPMWLHGDLHPHNIVVHGGQVVAVIDFGDICAGDPATDLLIAWQLFDEPERQIFRAAADSTHCPIDDAMWERGRGWAIFHSIAILANSADAPEINAVGRRGLHAALS
jgi:aminoglycoside phosphotransferase (APT) family kinase protein